MRPEAAIKRILWGYSSGTCTSSTGMSGLVRRNSANSGVRVSISSTEPQVENVRPACDGAAHPQAIQAATAAQAKRVVAVGVRFIDRWAGMELIVAHRLGPMPGRALVWFGH